MLRKLDLLPLEAEVGNFYSVTAATRRIGEIEGRDGDTHGLFLEFYVETGEWAPTRSVPRLPLHQQTCALRYQAHPTELMPDTRSDFSRR
jgi:hypothetical protein